MLGSLIGAGSSLLGGLLGRSSAKSAAKAQYRHQKEFAQNAVQWKVADAQKAGIHPLYALGAPTTSYAPVSVGDGGFSSSLASAGQDLGRAVNAGADTTTRASAYQSTVQELTIQRMGLENELLSSQIAKINQAGSLPPAPSHGNQFLIEGQSGSGPSSSLFSDRAMRREMHNPSRPAHEAAPVTDIGYTRTASGGYAPVMSHDAKQRLEEDHLGVLLWNLRNRLLPTAGFNRSTPYDPPGKDFWVYNPITQEYVLMDGSKDNRPKIRDLAKRYNPMRF